jgi:two-component system, OmpR family, copper resistance phosphate regulon response regulator CusR
LKLLVIEDEAKIADLIKRGIESAGYQVELAPTGAAGLEHLHQAVFDLLIVDLMLPDIDGFELLRKIRNRRVATPILVLSARDAVNDRVDGLEAGADDYLVKPFAFVELIARIRALLRRGVSIPERIQVGDLSLDCIRRRVTRAGQLIELAPKEFAILEYMMRNQGRPLSRTMIVEHVWDLDYDGLTNIVDVYIRHLRGKIDDQFPQKMIQTVRGVGYLLESAEKAARA